MSVRLVILKTGSTFPSLRALYGDFEDWILAGMKMTRQDAAIVDATLNHAVFPAPDEVDGVVITGSHAMVTERHAWSERAARWIRELVDHRIPLLGICYGHQLLAHALGGVVGPNPNGLEFGTTDVRMQAGAADDPLFGHLPPEFAVHVSHAQSVLHLPPGAVVLAANAMEPYHAFVVGENAWGVQFHPEFDAEITRQYIRAYTPQLASQGEDTRQLLRACRATPLSTALLKTFLERLQHTVRSAYSAV